MNIPAIQYKDATKQDKRFRAPGSPRLTRYEFCCGYTQTTETPGCDITRGISLTLWMEHNTFHVRAHNFDSEEVVDGVHGRVFWDSFNTMTAANQRFYKAKRELGL